MGVLVLDFFLFCLFWVYFLYQLLRLGKKVLPMQLYLYDPNRHDSSVSKKVILDIGHLHSSEEVTKKEAKTKIPSLLFVCLPCNLQSQRD